MPKTTHQRLSESIEKHRDRALERLERLVRVDSGSGNPAGILEAGDVLLGAIESQGFEVETHEPEGAGRHLILRRKASGPHLFLCAHLDTVFEQGSFSGFRIEGNEAIGPGVVDCKGGVVVIWELIDAFAETGLLDQMSVTLVLNGDEETGSHTSRELIEQAAQGADYALIFEGARPSGNLVSYRRGNGIFFLTSHGKAAHAGVSHAEGVNAIEELAHKIVAVQALTDYDRGLTVNAGVIRGGTKRNIVPDTATAELDVRYDKQSDGEDVDREIRELCAVPSIDGARTEVSGGLNRPPWPADDPGIRKLVDHWLATARDLGIELDAESTGGGSDGNWTAAMGIPTLDGLGPVGGKYHTVGEYLLVDTLAERTTLAAMAIERLLPSHE